jgi:hypothetical protein
MRHICIVYLSANGMDLGDTSTRMYSGYEVSRHVEDFFELMLHVKFPGKDLLIRSRCRTLGIPDVAVLLLRQPLKHRATHWHGPLLICSTVPSLEK